MGALIENIRPRLNEPWIRQLVGMLELHTIALRRAYQQIADLGGDFGWLSLADGSDWI